MLKSFQLQGPSPLIPDKGLDLPLDQVQWGLCPDPEARGSPWLTDAYLETALVAK